MFCKFKSVVVFFKTLDDTNFKWLIDWNEKTDDLECYCQISDACITKRAIEAVSRYTITAGQVSARL